MMEKRMVLWACVWSCVLACAGAVEMEMGMYNDLVVAIDPTMPMDAIDVGQIKDKFTALMNDMAEAMRTATKDRLSVNTVRVVLPHWWNNTGALNLQPPEERFSWHSADIRVKQPLDIGFGKYEIHAPNTLQMGQCGVPGRYITIHTTFLEDGYSEENYGDRGHVLMHEWAHYRWGVFDEYGHPKDPKYPVSYGKDDDREVSACSAGELPGEFLTVRKGECPGDPNDASNPCYFFANESSNPADTKSSLMGHTFLSDGSFCTKETHNSLAPTPQNALCGGRSVWEVLEAHPDFKEPGVANTNPPTITFHKASMPRVFVLFDEPPKDLEWYVKAYVQAFIRNATEEHGSVELGMATFSSAEDGTVEFYNEFNFTQVSSYSAIEGYLPEGVTNPPSSKIQVGEAVLELLLDWEPYEPGTVIVALTYNDISENVPEGELTTELLDGRVKLLVLSPLGSLGSVLPMIPTLQNTGGNFYVPDRNSIDTTDRLGEDLYRYLKENSFNDHKLVGVSNQEVEAGSTVNLAKTFLEYRGQGETFNGYLRITPFSDPDLIDITLTNSNVEGSASCNDNNPDMELYCQAAPDGLFLYFYTNPRYWVQNEYTVTIKNKGNEKIVVDGTWSMVDDSPSVSPMWVDVWSSESAGVKAAVQEADSLYLYCQVFHSGGVLQNVEVKAEVEFDDGVNKAVHVVSLSDGGDGVVDVKAKDTVWSAKLAGSWSEDTTLTVTKLAINRNPDVFSPFLGSSSLRRQEAGGSGSRGSSGSNVLPIDPRDADCLSYSTGNTLGTQNDIDQMLIRPYTVTFTSDITNVPPQDEVIVNLDSQPEIVGNTVKVTIHLGGTETSKRTRSAMYEYWARYHPDAATLQNNFLSAKEPLDGAEAPITATSMTVTLPFDTTADVFLSVAVVDTLEETAGPPSSPITITMPTTTTTTPTTTTPTTTTPAPGTDSTTTPTSTPPSPGTDSTPTSSTSTTTTTTTTTAAPETKDNTVVIVVSVVCSLLALGIAGGLFYYFKYYRKKTA